MKLSTPVAILIGSVLIAGAVYFGLRSQPSPQPIATNTASPTAAPVPVSVSPTDLQRLVEAALAEHRALLAARCTPDGGVARWTFELTFAADGRQLGRGVREDRATGNAPTTSCVLDNLPPLHLRAIGRPMKTTVVLQLP